MIEHNQTIPIWKVWPAAGLSIVKLCAVCWWLQSLDPVQLCMMGYFKHWKPHTGKLFQKFESNVSCPAGGEWRLKYERAIREIEFTKKRLQQEFDDKLEVEQQNKRQLERRVRRAHTHTPPSPQGRRHGWSSLHAKIQEIRQYNEIRQQKLDNTKKQIKFSEMPNSALTVK